MCRANKKPTEEEDSNEGKRHENKSKKWLGSIMNLKIGTLALATLRFAFEGLHNGLETSEQLSRWLSSASD